MTQHNSILKIAGLVVLPLVWTACGVTKKYDQPPVAQQVADSLYRDHYSSDTQSMANVPWKEVFVDPNLQVLIDKALARNYDFRNTILQIAQAEALYQQRKLAFLPRLSFSPQATYSPGSNEALNFPAEVNIRDTPSPVQLGLGTNWELDVWGKLGRAKR